MLHEFTRRLDELKREIERQDEQWGEVERHIRNLADLRIAISRSVIEEIDEAFSAKPRAVMPAHFTQC